jgi:protein ImuB
MSLAHARSLLKDDDPFVAPLTPEDDAAALRRLARWALKFSPTVAPDEPDGLLLDLSGCGRLFGGAAAHLRTIAGACERMGLAVRLAAAPTFAAARALAHCGERRLIVADEGNVLSHLAPLPVGALGVSPEALSALLDVGIERVGDLLKVPRAELLRRFGPALPESVDRLTGRQSETVVPLREDAPLELCHAFDTPMRRPEIVRNVVGHLLGRLLRLLGDRGLAPGEWRLVFRRAGRDAERITLALAHPTLDGRHLESLLEMRLQRLRIGCGIEDISLAAARCERVAPQQGALWEDAHAASPGHQPQALGALVDRLAEQFGRPSLVRYEPVEDRLPEHAFRATTRLPAMRPGAPPSRPGPRAAIGTANRPSRLWTPPQAAEVIALLPDGPPAWLRWRGGATRVRSSTGPERIAAAWWKDGPGALRDYYEVQDEQGRFLWVFRARPSGRWFVHGEWA